MQEMLLLLFVNNRCITVDFSHSHCELFCLVLQVSLLLIATKKTRLSGKKAKRIEKKRFNCVEMKLYAETKKAFQFNVVSFKKHLAHDDMFP